MKSGERSFMENEKNLLRMKKEVKIYEWNVGWKFVQLQELCWLFVLGFLIASPFCWLCWWLFAFWDFFLLSRVKIYSCVYMIISVLSVVTIEGIDYIKNFNARLKNCSTKKTAQLILRTRTRAKFSHLHLVTLNPGFGSSRKLKKSSWFGEISQKPFADETDKNSSKMNTKSC